MSPPSHGIGDTSSFKSGPSLDTLEADTAKEKHSKPLYIKQQSDENYKHGRHHHHHQCKQHDNTSVHQRDQAQTKKKRYTPSTVTHYSYGEHYNRHHHGYVEGKENLPSPKIYHHDSYHYNCHAASFDYGHYEAQSVYHREYKQPHDHGKDWNHHQVRREAYNYHGHSHPYPYSNDSVESSGNVYGENGSFHLLRDCRGYSFVDHTYRDFSGVPPTDEDRERYNNKKKEFERRLKEQKAYSENTEAASTEDSVSRALKKKRGRGNRATKNESGFIGFMGTNFPARLHDLLSHEEEISDIITWLPHGRSWIVLDKSEFLKKVAPSHFQISKFESFTRQVNGWGFKRITQGPDINSYYHELFLRGMPHLIQWMKRTTSSGAGRRKMRGDPKDEPDFYAISQMYPIPDYYGDNGGQVVTRPSYQTEIYDGSKLKCDDEKSNSSSNGPMPSPIQIEKFSSQDKSGNNDIKKTNHHTRSSNEPHYHKERYNTFPRQSYDPNGSVTDTYGSYFYHTPHSNDVTQVQNYWKSNGNYVTDPYYPYSGHYHRPSSTHNYARHKYASPYRQHENIDEPYVDIKPAEGTIGDRESFCWDDAEYVRQYRCNKNVKHSDGKKSIHPNSSATVSDDSNENGRDFFSNHQDDNLSKTINSVEIECNLSSTQGAKKSINIGGIYNISPLKVEVTSIPSPITYPLSRGPPTTEVETLYGNGVNDLPEPSSWALI